MKSISRFALSIIAIRCFAVRIHQRINVHSPANASFETRWKAFRDVVPFSKLQDGWDRSKDLTPVCHPALVGPQNSDKLAILMHGFLGCPGMWFRLVPRLVQAGFRVMLPVLPGHGRKPRPGAGGFLPTLENLLRGVLDPSNGTEYTYEDDVDAMPDNAHEYYEFATELAQLAERFKLEHPRGLVVVAGHSLGGAVTAAYAMRRPNVIDRVLLLNPMLGLSWGSVDGVARWTPDVSITKGASCEKQRRTGITSGGTCQFQLKHVTAMVEFAFAVLCCKWGLPEACGNGPRTRWSFLRRMGILGSETTAEYTCEDFGFKNFNEDLKQRYRRRFGEMKGFQVVTTIGENLVDNQVISEFVGVVRSQRSDKPNGVTSKLWLDFCYWPSELGHAYMSNRLQEGDEEKWWHPYVESALAKFLIRGRNLDIVGDKTSNLKTRMCLKRKEDIQGDMLRILPASQHTNYYTIADVGLGHVLWQKNGVHKCLRDEQSALCKAHIELLNFRDIGGTSNLGLAFAVRPRPQRAVGIVFYIKADAPIGWEKTWSVDHNKFYWGNRDTQQSSWTMPQPEVARAIVGKSVSCVIVHTCTQLGSSPVSLTHECRPRAVTRFCGPDLAQVLCQQLRCQFQDDPDLDTWVATHSVE